MFSRIDQFFITTFQWTVRQLELYTLITRKIILSILFLSVLCLTALRTLLAVGLLGVHPGAMLLASGFIFTLPHVHKLYSAAKKVESLNQLPKEIKTRYSNRVMALFGVILAVIFMYSFTRFFQFNDKADWLILMGVETLYYEVWCVWAIEYLLCTTSLPPGEKEKRKLQKKMRYEAFNP